MLPLYPVLLVAGYFLNTTEGLDLVLLPVINVLVLSLPVAWLVWLGTRDLPQMALQRNWSVFGFSMTVSPLVIIILELLLFFLGLVFISFLAIAFFRLLWTGLKSWSGCLRQLQPVWSFQSRR